jgi:hypothetical protein
MFATGGYCPQVVEDWITKRLLRGDIVAIEGSTLRFSDHYLDEFRRKLDQLE